MTDLPLSIITYVYHRLYATFVMITIWMHLQQHKIHFSPDTAHS